jgi:phosphoglycerate dehydrogenase-like enzyme
MPETRHVINEKTLALMKPSAYLINTARGGLVCEADLEEALRNKKIAGAALDVFEKEPPGKTPLLELESVVATAHTAGVDCESMLEMAHMAARAVVALSRGQWPAEWIVNPEAKGRFHW